MGTAAWGDQWAGDGGDGGWKVGAANQGVIERGETGVQGQGTGYEGAGEKRGGEVAVKVSGVRCAREGRDRCAGEGGARCMRAGGRGRG